MIDERESYVFYRSFYEAISDLDNPLDRLALHDAIAAYSLDGVTPELTGLPRTLWRLIEPNLAANNKRFKDGKNGGRPRKKPKETTGYEKNKPLVILGENHSLPIEETTGYEKNKPNKDKDKDVDKDVDKDKNEKKIPKKRQTEAKKPKVKITGIEDKPLPVDICRKAWVGFVEMRRAQKKPLTERAANLIIEKLEKLNGDKTEILNNSTANCWLGVFEQKEKNYANYQPSWRQGNKADRTEAAVNRAMREIPDPETPCERPEGQG